MRNAQLTAKFWKRLFRPEMINISYMLKLSSAQAATEHLLLRWQMKRGRFLSQLLHRTKSAWLLGGAHHIHIFHISYHLIVINTDLCYLGGGLFNILHHQSFNGLQYWARCTLASLVWCGHSTTSRWWPRKWFPICQTLPSHLQTRPA